MTPGAIARAILAIGLTAVSAREARAQRRCRVAEVVISQPDAQVSVGQHVSFLPTPYDAAGNPCTEAVHVFTWSSNNVNVATVDSNGTATGVTRGVAILTARTGTGAAARFGQATIQVASAPTAGTCDATSVGLQNRNNECWDTRPMPLAVPMVAPPAACGGSATPATVLARVSAEGAVLGTPTATIRGSCPAFALMAAAFIEDMTFRPAMKLGTPVPAWIAILVRPAPLETNGLPSSKPVRPTGPGCAAYERQPSGTGVPEALYVNPLRLSLVRGESRQLEYRTVSGDSTASPVCIVFEPDPAGARVASVDSFGIVSAGSDTGRTWIRAIVQGARVPSRRVTVDVRDDSIAFEQGEISLSPGGLEPLRIVVPRQGNRPFMAAPNTFSFSSSDTSVVHVDLKRPVVLALRPGAARITAESNLYPPMTAAITVRPR